MESNIIKDQYDSMGFFYNIFYASYEPLYMENTFISEHKELLDTLHKGARILDSSCGNGVQATALKREGFDVTATDISQEMVNLSKRYSIENNLLFPIKCLAWNELPHVYNNYFDIVFCWGNSISHSINEEDMINNLTAFYKITRGEGKVVLSTRNWDKLVNRNIRFESLQVREYDNKKYIPTYVWNLSDFNKSSYVEIVFIEIINNKETKCIPFRLDFTPFSHEAFVNRLKSCGFKINYDNFNNNTDYYYIVVEK